MHTPGVCYRQQCRRHTEHCPCQRPSWQLNWESPSAWEILHHGMEFHGLAQHPLEGSLPMEGGGWQGSASPHSGDICNPVLLGAKMGLPEHVPDCWVSCSLASPAPACWCPEMCCSASPAFSRPVSLYIPREGSTDKAPTAAPPGCARMDSQGQYFQCQASLPQKISQKHGARLDA